MLKPNDDHHVLFLLDPEIHFPPVVRQIFQSIELVKNKTTANKLRKAIP